MKTIKPVSSQQEFTIQCLSQEMAGMNSMDSTENPLGCHGNPLVQIEMYSRMICYGINNPFPHSRAHLAFALIGIKHQLCQISLAELVAGNPDIKEISFSTVRPDIRAMEELDQLLDCPMFANGLPTLKQAVRFVHSSDQQEIYLILKRKLNGSQD